MLNGNNIKNNTFILEGVYNLKKLIKIIFIVLFYLFIFWISIYGIRKLLYKKNNVNTEVVETITTDINLKNENTATTVSNTTTTTTTTKTTQKTTKKTTKKVTSKKQVKNKFTRVSTASIAEYQAYAHNLVINLYGWTESDFQALIKLWNHESGWNPNSYNKSSGACGIPQSLPCNKIYKQQGSYDWQAQIRWGLNYIRDRKGYGNPTKAWKHFQNYNWY